MNFSIPVFTARAEYGQLTWQTIGLQSFNFRRVGRSASKIEQGLLDDLRKAINKAKPGELHLFALSRGLELRAVRLDLALRSDGKKRRVTGLFPVILEPRWATDEEQIIMAYHPARQEEWFPYDPTRSLEEVASSYFQRVWATLQDWQIEELQSSKKDALKIISLSATPMSMLDLLREKKDTLFGDFAIAGGGSKSRGDMGVLRELGVDVTWLAAQGQLETGVPRSPAREQLSQLVAGRKKSSLLLVGPPGVGKSTALNMLVQDVLHAQDWLSHRNMDRVHRVWRISGRRLIAGMSYIGQWEERCVEVLEAARKHKTILWIDDLYAWGRIGRSRESERSLADFFRGPIARGELTVIGECTPSQLQTLEEDAPALAAAIGRVFMQPTTPGETMRMMMHESRGLELDHNVRFNPMTFRTIYDVGGGLLSTMSFPGKALELLRSLARRAEAPDQLIRSQDVISLLSERTGIPKLLLEPSTPLDPARVRRDIEEQIMGQPEAVDAAVNLIVRIKAGLTDPRRPYSVFLFTGPTGTGKTEMAKSIAAYLYGDESRLLRFDMSEYATPDAAGRLVGDPWRPNGALTSQVRQQPFCVVLFDEIEKAEPSILNLMLQLFDEGTLTDAAGNVADFSHAVIIMTSNLGSRRDSTIGFGEDASAYKHDATRAVQEFFAPELFNRIDEIVRFGPLPADVARLIASKELSKLLARRGLTERDVFMTVSDAVIDYLCEEGFDQRDGARSLKRFLEREIASRISENLVENAGAQMRSVRIWRDQSSGKIELGGQVICEAEPTDDATRLEPLLELGVDGLTARLPDAVAFLEVLEGSDALDELIISLREHLGEFNVALDHEREPDEVEEGGELVQVADQIYNLEMMRSRIARFRSRLQEYLDNYVNIDERELIEMEVDYQGIPPVYDEWGYAKYMAHQRRLIQRSMMRPTISLMSGEQILRNLAEVYFLRRSLERAHDPLRHAITIELFRFGRGHKHKRFGRATSALLDHMSRAYATARGELEGWALHTTRGVTVQGRAREDLLDALDEHTPVHVVIRLVGLCIRDIFEAEDGTHVRTSLGDSPEIVRVVVADAPASEDARGALLARMEARRAFEAALQSGTALPDDPDALGPLVRRVSFEDTGDSQFLVDLEDYRMSWATRRRVSRLSEVLEVLWMLRMGSQTIDSDDGGAE